MTETEWYALLDSTLDPTAGAGAVVQLKDAVTAALAKSQSDADTIATLTEENKRLRDTNSQLALRVTSSIKIEEPEPEEKTPEQAFDDLINRIKEERKND